MIDAHTHLYSDKYRHDLDQVILRAQKKLDGVIISAVDSASLAVSLDIQRRYPDFIHVTGGIHPRKAVGLNEQDHLDLWRAVEKVRHQIVAVGEVGPDFHHTKNARDQQRQLELLDDALSRAESWNLPLVVHARGAESAALEVLARSRIPVMFHCFAGSKQVAG